MLRLADPTCLRAHQARFDLARVPREDLEPLDARRLDALLERPYEDLDARDATCALGLLHRAGLLQDLFPYFLPAVLRRPPYRDVVAAERFLAGLLACRSDPGLSAWEPEIEQTLVHWLTTRPLRGGDDPVDLWLSDAAGRLLELEAARRTPRRPRRRAGLTSGWTQAAEGPLYARVALVLLQRSAAAAERRFRLWEAAGEDNLQRTWVEVMFHALGEGWWPDPVPLDGVLDAAERLDAAEVLLSHAELDIAVGAAAVARLLAPRRAHEWQERVESRLRALDDGEQERFVLVPSVRRLLAG